jgi:hypothetical protein
MRGFSHDRAIGPSTIRGVSSESDDSLPVPDPAILAAPTAELDVVEGFGRQRKHRQQVRPPHVRLGALQEGGVAPAIMAIVERGVRRRPGLANALRGEIEINLDEGYPPVRLVFGDSLVLVEDAPGVAPDIMVSGSLPDLISLMVTPTWAGLPNPINARGRAALGLVALGRLRIEGRVGLMRRLLSVIRI